MIAHPATLKHEKCHIFEANVLICHKIHHIFMIYLLLLQNLVVAIYALFLAIFGAKKLFNSYTAIITKRLANAVQCHN